MIEGENVLQIILLGRRLEHVPSAIMRSAHAPSINLVRLRG